MTRPNDDLADQASQLRDQIADLADAVRALAERSTLTDQYARRNRRVVVGLALSLVLDVALTAGLFYTQHRQAAYVACQAAYNEVNNRRTTILTDVNTRGRDAQRARDDALDATFLDPSLLKPAGSRSAADVRRVLNLFATYRAAAQKLQAERVAADATRAANPVLPPPSKTCG